MKSKIRQRLGYFIPSVFTALIVMLIYRKYGLYPFGGGSVSWCDMNQQSIPLLMDLKDILDGKESIFFNMKNAGGMNFYGVFFFFLSSPINLLVKFVDKQDMILFVNILVVLKLALSALTANIYFRRCHSKLHIGECAILSVVYALCGFGLMFYQNQMWLDVMYIFPLLVIALEILMLKENNLPYIAALSAIIFCNYYLSFMVALFIILFAGIYVFYGISGKRACIKLISGTLFSLLITAFVWLPSFIQVRSSGRTIPIKDSIGNTHFLANYDTSILLILCSGLVFAVVGANMLLNKSQSRDAKLSLLMFVAMLLPVFLEPINLAWHTGNYQSFPVRYGFITIFCGLRCCAVYWCEDAGRKKPVPATTARLVFGILGALLPLWYYIRMLPVFVDQHFDELTHYTSSLWGDKNSLDRLSELFVFALVCYLTVYVLYRKGAIIRENFILFIAVLVFAESSVNVKLYVASPYIKDNSRTDNFVKITELADKLPDDDGVYRVITEGKITDYNMIGAMGYNSLGHYTSLTDNDFMNLQKRLGYTSVWMNVGSHGGSDFTNALYGAKYKIIRGEPSAASVYSNDVYYIEQMPLSVGPAILTDSDLSGCEYLSDSMDRADVQRYIFQSLYGVDPITEYQPEDQNSIEYSNNLVCISNGTVLDYKINVSGDQTLYADCSGNFTNSLSEPYFESLNISVNDNVLRSSFPTGTDNGLLELGRFKNETVHISIMCKKNIAVGSFGVFGFDNDILQQKVAETESAELNYKHGKLTVNAQCSSDKTCLLTVPYNEGFTVRVNGKKAEYSRAFSSFLSISLESGDNEISVTYLPKGFAASAVLSLVGVCGLAIYIKFFRKNKIGDHAATAANYAVKIAVLLAFIIIYIYPMIINLTYVKDK